MILRGSVYSEVLEMHTGITIITPKLKPSSPPAVAYLFHGLSADNGMWTESSLLPVYAEEYNAVFVMPEVGRSYYFDLRHGQKFFTYVADELPDIVASQFSISRRREDTAVIDVSMGGNGALRTAFARPERFGMCYAVSSGLLYMREHIERLKKMNNREAVAKVFGPQRVADFRCMFGEELEVRPEERVSYWAEKAAASSLRPRLYTACGTEDPFHKLNIRFRDELRGLGFDFTYEEWPGAHDAIFFNEALRRSLAFCFADGHALPVTPLALPTLDDD